MTDRVVVMQKNLSIKINNQMNVTNDLSLIRFTLL